MYTNQSKRILKVQEVGDHYNKKEKPQIKLEGKWLANAGIIPESHIEVTNPEKGVLVIRSIK